MRLWLLFVSIIIAAPPQQIVFAPSKLKCSACKTALNVMKGVLEANRTAEQGMIISIKLCKLFKIQSDLICDNMVPSFGKILQSVMTNQLFDSEWACASLDLCEFDVTAPPMPQPSFISQFIRPLVKLIQPSKQSKILHLSDWHYDPDYHQGYEGECSGVICCRDAPNGTEIKSPAGKYGHYRCDTPKELSKEVVKEAYSKQVDFVVSTGDLPPHDLWEETRESVQQAYDHFTDTMMAFTPKNIRVFPVVGNHENYLVNQFPTRDLNDDDDVGWLYEELARQWKPWFVGEEAAYDTFKKFGYYAMQMKDRNLKVIALNTNHAYLLNWFTFLKKKPTDETKYFDPDGMFSFLIKELYESESAGQDVYLIGHLPPGSPDVGKIYGRTLNQVVQRFHETIKAHFYGHTHKDEMELFYSAKSTGIPDAINVAYIGPSITTFTSLNPGYRVYETVDNLVTNHRTFVLDLPLSNEKEQAVWFEEYDAASAYNMRNLEPQSWHQLTEVMLSEVADPMPEQAMLKKYIQFKYKSANSSEALEPCDAKCQKEMICSIRSAENFNTCQFSSLAGVYEQVEARKEYPLC